MAALRTGATLFRCPSFATYNIFIRNFSAGVAHLSPRTRLFATASPQPPPVGLADLFTEAPTFPELLLEGKSSVLIGVDPDTHGALAVLRWQNIAALPPLIKDDSSFSAPDIVAAAEIEVIDMPTEIMKLRARDKKQPSPEGVLTILRDITAKAELSNEVIRATLEHTTPTHLSGKYAWYCSGFATGMLTSMFIAQGIVFEKVPATLWKKQMGLNKLGKAGSLDLARQLFPQAGGYLK